MMQPCLVYLHAFHLFDVHPPAVQRRRPTRSANGRARRTAAWVCPRHRPFRRPSAAPFFTTAFLCPSAAASTAFPTAPWHPQEIPPRCALACLCHRPSPKDPCRRASMERESTPKRAGTVCCVLVCAHKTFAKGRSISSRSTENGPAFPESSIVQPRSFTGAVPAHLSTPSARLFLPPVPCRGQLPSPLCSWPGGGGGD